MTGDRTLRRRVLAGVTAAGLIASVALLPGAASAATNQLTVVTLGRNGKPLSVPVSVLNLTDHTTYTLTSGRTKALPKGTYAVMTDIYDPKDATDTIGARVVTVSGNTRTTIDARAGEPVRVTLSPRLDQGDQSLQAQVCADSFVTSAIGGWNTSGKLFVIPNSSRHLEFDVMSRWDVPAETGPGTGYVVAHTTTGLPKGLGLTVKRSTLANVLVDARRGPADAPQAAVFVQPGGKGCASILGAGFSPSTTPYRLPTYLSAGAWKVSAETYTGSELTDSSSRDVKVTAGKRYRYSYFNAAWGPGPAMPLVIRKNLDVDLGGMFVDPTFWNDFTTGATSRYALTLSRSGTVLKRQKGTTYGSADGGSFRYRLRSAGWYVLAVDASRYRPGVTFPSDQLSTRTTTSFRFYADPAKDQVARVHLIRFMPQGLNLSNQAPPRSTTTVALGVDRPAQDPDAKLTKVGVKSVTAQASYDNGKTWRAVKVTQVKGRWSAAVPNPDAGTVSLRATVVSTTGDSSQITVYKAYAIG